MLFLDPVHYLNRETEKAEYDLHQNSPSDLNYRHFLSQLVDPLIRRLKLGDQGLDFGSGPGPTLNVILAEAGFSVNIYDLFYAPNQNVLEQRYDFITATEVVEHLQNPLAILNKLWAILEPNGNLAIMTQCWNLQTNILNWKYKDDPTHVVFFSTLTFEWLAKYWNAQVDFISRNVIFFKKIAS